MITMDKPHNQNIAVIKAFRGTICLTEDKYKAFFSLFLPILSYLFRELQTAAQSVKCLATDVSLAADPGVASLIPAWSHTFVEIDHEIISTVILLASSESFKKGCSQ